MLPFGSHSGSGVLGLCFSRGLRFDFEPLQAQKARAPPATPLQTASDLIALRAAVLTLMRLLQRTPVSAAVSSCTGM
ncbi:hypothetical protein T484DRAFT_1943791 [Baffinella frigidus]|nr:hypothetical protein T484DRAFT_1943791 [Cryptophyta sp. CCMP2293]